MECLLRDSTAAENAKKKQGEKDKLIKKDAEYYRKIEFYLYSILNRINKSKLKFPFLCESDYMAVALFPTQLA